MTPSNQKGNIQRILLACVVICLTITGLLVAKTVFFSTIPGGKYNNPQVAQKVIGGTIYDRNSRVLSIEVPRYRLTALCGTLNPAQKEVFAQILSLFTDKTPGEIKTLTSDRSSAVISDDFDNMYSESLTEELEKYGLEKNIEIKRGVQRNYPCLFHACHVIAETENEMNLQISPLPEINKEETYGCNVWLTIDLDVQYLLDIAAQQVAYESKSDIVIASVTETETGKTVAITTYPYYDLNQSFPEEIKNTAFLSRINRLSPYFVEYVDDGFGNKHKPEKTFFSHDDHTAIAIYDNVNGSCKIQTLGKFTVLIGCSAKNAETTIDRAVKNLESGLKSQSKL